MINFRWHAELRYRVSRPNYICISNVRHYCRRFGTALEGHCEGARKRANHGRSPAFVLQQHWHEWQSTDGSPLTESATDSLRSMENKSNQILIMSSKPHIKTVQFITGWPLPVIHSSLLQKSSEIHVILDRGSKTHKKDDDDKTKSKTKMGKQIQDQEPPPWTGDKREIFYLKQHHGQGWKGQGPCDSWPV